MNQERGITMFKNLFLCRIGPECPSSADQLAEALADDKWIPFTDQRAFNNAYLWGKPQP